MCGIVVRMFTHAQIRALLRAQIKEYGSQAKFAGYVGVSPQYLNDVLKGHRAPGTKLLKALGYELVREIRPVT